MESFGINLGIEIFIFNIDFFLYIFLLLLQIFILVDLFNLQGKNLKY